MRDIHPELLLEETKHVFRNVSIELNWQAYLNKYPKWEHAIQFYIKNAFKTAISVPDVDPGQLITVLTYPLFDWITKRCIHPFSYHTLMSTKEYEIYCDAMIEILQQAYGTMAESAFNSVIIQNLTMFACINWEKCGKKTYTVTPKLTEALRATKINKYPSELLRSPHASIYIEFPHKTFFAVADADAVTPSETGYVTFPVEGVYIMEDDAIEDMRLWRIIIVSQYAEKPATNVQVNHFYIPLIEGASIDECLAISMEMMKGRKELPVQVKGSDKTTYIGGNYGNSWDKKIIDCAVEIFKFVMNVVIYVTRSDADITFAHISPEYANFKERMLKAQGKKREELKQRMRGFNPGVRILLGKDYVIKRWDGEAKVAGEATGRHITVRTLVSGHWRNQACGVGSLDRKTIWIEPHWRGPEAAPLTEKRAVVK